MNKEEEEYFDGILDKAGCETWPGATTGNRFLVQTLKDLMKCEAEKDKIQKKLECVQKDTCEFYQKHVSELLYKQDCDFKQKNCELNNQLTQLSQLNQQLNHQLTHFTHSNNQLNQYINRLQVELNTKKPKCLNCKNIEAVGVTIPCGHLCCSLCAKGLTVSNKIFCVKCQGVISTVQFLQF